MNTKQLRSQLTFNRSQRAGVFFLIATILAIGYMRFFVTFSEGDSFDLSSSEIQVLQCVMDSLKMERIAAQKPKRYPFNPNFLTDYKAYTLGVSPEGFDRLQKYRAQGQWINSVADFKRITRVSDSLLAEISPLFKFPDWIYKSNVPGRNYQKRTFLATGEKQDLNKASVAQLMEISGIGEVLSKRIVERREQLGGFSHDFQLYDVWGLQPMVVERTLLQFTVKTPSVIDKMNINTISASDLATIPGISFQKAKKIWEFVRLREGVNDLSELLKIEGISSRKLKVFELYLFAE